MGVKNIYSVYVATIFGVSHAQNKKDFISMPKFSFPSCLVEFKPNLLAIGLERTI